jgi:F-box protein 21
MEIYSRYRNGAPGLNKSRTDLNKQISDLFDDLVKRLHTEYPRLNELSSRKKALAAASFLRRHNLTGIPTELAYRDLQNNYIGIALQDSDHPSLPLVSVAIFCAVVQRLGLDARCCGIPNHVHAIVFPPVGETLDGRPLLSGEIPPQPMYLDPYRSEEEVPLPSLRKMLSQWGIQTIQHSQFLADSSTTNVVLKTSRNILATVHEFRGHGGTTENTGHPTISLYANPFADLDSAFYSALWANFIFGNPLPSSEWTQQRQFIPLILERFERLYPMDASLIEKYIIPLYNNPTNAEHHELHGALRVVRAADQTPKQLKQRDSSAAQDSVKYRVGQVFRHRRYNYIAVITGWDLECGMTPHWIATNDVDSLSRGRHQSFYHAL